MVYKSDTFCTYQHIQPHTQGERSCFDATFHGENAQQMSVNGCAEYASCFGVALYCPPNTNNSANCFIHGDNHLLIRLYALNGWPDIFRDNENVSSFGVYHEGTMHCGNEYGTECDISSDAWSCDGDVCNDVNANGIQIESTPGGNIVAFVNETNQILPDLSSDFEHGSMGMVLIGGGLIALAVVCIVAVVFKAGVAKMRLRMDKTSKEQMGYHQNAQADMAEDEDGDVCKEFKRTVRSPKQHRHAGVNV